jgi:uroporphyrinogen-III synthase
MPTAERLKGVTVVVTRPAHQANVLCELINGEGGKTIRFPVLEITAPSQPLALNQVQAKLSDANVVIFISPNAVEYGLKIIRDAGGFPETVQVAAVGQGTAKTLSQSGRPADIFPTQQYNSEALLAMSELQSVSGQRIIICRGEGGRELLAETLRSRGANVDYVECYQRIQPDSDTKELRSALSAKTVDAVVVTSNQGLQNLHDMLDSADLALLKNIQLFVVSDRGQRLAVELGFSTPAIIVDKASDQGILDSLLEWRSNS